MSIQARAMQYGKLFGDWKIREFIGEGSQGKTGVFRIIKTYGGFQDESALKVVTVLREDGWPEELTEEARREYQANKAALCGKAVSEVELMKRLAGDPYVVSYQNWEFCDWEESGQFGCDLLIQMRLLATLDRLQKRGERFSEGEICRVGQDICRALIHCDEEGILHRDIKPANIFTAPDRRGSYMLGDFGVSRIVESGLGGASTRVGTPEYAAPEQFELEYDKRVDIYSLGLTLYELANRGRLPFREPGRDSREAILLRLEGGALPAPSEAGPALAKVILKACAFRPEDRYQSAREFLEALEALRPGQTAEAPARAVPVQPVSAGPVNSGAESGKHAENTVDLWAVPLEEVLHRAEQGDAAAQDNMGMRCYLGKGVVKSYGTAVAWFHEAAGNGNAHAMSYLGICYGVGLGVEKDPQMAYTWTRKAAEHGDVAAMRMLGTYYRSGNGVERDLKAAAAWFHKAAELGSVEALNDLGCCYFDGAGVEKDQKAAAEWFRRGADKGNAMAQFNLGKCLLSGSGVEADPAEAVSWLTKAAEKGNKGAQNSLGGCYQNGRGVERNPAAAVFWYQKAAEQGDANAQLNLGRCCYNGFGVEQNWQSAAVWFRKAADHGLADAQDSLGLCYQFGHGVERDLQTAAQWFRKAAAKGYVPAIEHLNAIKGMI